MDKKTKLLLLILPVGALVVGYSLYQDNTENQSEVNNDESFTSIDAPATEAPKKRTELYRDEYEADKGKAQRRIESDDSFFGEEIKKDTSYEIQKPETEIIIKEEEPTQTIQEPIVTETKTKAVKERVVVKYIDRPVQSQQIEQSKPVENTPVIQERKVRQRTGFVQRQSGVESSQAIQSKQTSPQIEILDEVNIEAVVQNDVNVKQGNNITLRTTKDAIINGNTVPKNTLVTGTVSLNGDRVDVAVSNIKSSSKSFPVKLKVFDLDGNEGIYISSDVDTDIKRELVNDAIGATRSIVNAPILRNIPSVGEKKVNDPSVPIPKGYKIFIRN